jgi:hypothetical protein
MRRRALVVAKVLVAARVLEEATSEEATPTVEAGTQAVMAAENIIVKRSPRYATAA